MGTEIERKFLVVGDGWRARATGTPYRQGYLSTDPERAVRVRLEGERAKLTIKAKTPGNALRRLEMEYEIPPDDAHELLERCFQPLIEKTRYRLEHAGHGWEIDVFEGANAGLVIAEIELEDEAEAFERPDWLGEEVSSDPRYLNANLGASPYSTW